MMRFLVTGSRYWSDREMLFASLDAWHEIVGVASVIEGCARGADGLAEEWAAERGIPNRHFPADWARYGKAAGAIRNSLMLADGEPDFVLAFHDDITTSKGTADMMTKAIDWGLPVQLHSHRHSKETP